MAVKSGFFNSDEGDRLYLPSDFEWFFQGIVPESGILINIGEWFKTVVDGGMDIIVKPGMAIYDRSFMYSDSDISFTLSAADPTLDRIDAVVFQWDWGARNHQIILVEGTPGDPPAIPNVGLPDMTGKYIVSTIYVPAGATELEQQHIEFWIGYRSVSGFIVSLLQNVNSTDVMYPGWKARLQSLMSYWDDAITEMYTTGELAELEDIKDQQKVQNLIINGDFQIRQRGFGESFTVHTEASQAENPYTHFDRWQCIIKKATVGEYRTQPYTLTTGQEAMLVGVVTAGVATDFDAFVSIQQIIEGSRCTDILKGTADAKRMTLSFSVQTSQVGTYIVDLTQYVDDVPTYIVSYPFTHPGGGVKQDYVWTIPLHSQGPISNDENAALRLSFILMAGWNYRSYGSIPHQAAWGSYAKNKRASGISNLVGTATYKSWMLYDVQLTVGEEAFPFQKRPYTEQLKACRRYFEGYDSYIIPSKSETDPDNARGLLTFKETKRVTPVISTVGAAALRTIIESDAIDMDVSSLAQPNPLWLIQELGDPTRYSIDEKEQAIIHMVGNYTPFGYKYPKWLAFTDLSIDADFQLE